VAALTTDDGYNPIYDSNSPNGRRYSFGDMTTFYGETGLRWGSNLKVADNITVRPWGGLAWGQNMSNNYQIHLDDHSVVNDMRGHYYIFRAGGAALWKDRTQVYLTLEWGGGSVTNNYTLTSGISYHW